MYYIHNTGDYKNAKRKIIAYLKTITGLTIVSGGDVLTQTSDLIKQVMTYRSFTIIFIYIYI
jgi:hypothetical protein